MNHQPTPLSDMDSLLSRAEVAQMFNVSPSTVTLGRRGQALSASAHSAGTRRYRKESILRLLRTLSRQTWKRLCWRFHGCMAIIMPWPSGRCSVRRRESRMYGSVHSRRFKSSSILMSSRAARSSCAWSMPAIRRGNHRDNAPAAVVGKDPAWDQMGLRMTQTYGIGGQA